MYMQYKTYNPWAQVQEELSWAVTSVSLIPPLKYESIINSTCLATDY